jgi:hypothetical protein
MNEELTEAVRLREELFNMSQKNSGSTHKGKLWRVISEQPKKSDKAEYFIRCLFSHKSIDTKLPYQG